MTRFWTVAAIEPGEGGWRVLLDERPVRTPVSLGKEAFAFYDEQMKYVVEPGEFQIMAGPNSVDLKATALTITQGSGRE